VNGEYLRRVLIAGINHLHGNHRHLALVEWIFKKKYSTNILAANEQTVTVKLQIFESYVGP